MSSFPSSSLIKAARGIPLIATPTIESASICRFSSSSRAMSDIAAAMNPMRFPYTHTDRQPIFTSFGASPPLIPRVKSQVTVSGDRCNSSAISFSERPFSLYSMALFAIEFTSFMRSPTPLRTMRDAGYQDVDDGKAGRQGERRRSDSAVPQSAVLGPTTKRDSHDHYGDADDREYNGSDDVRRRQSDGRKSGAVEHQAETEDQNDEPNYENHSWGGETGIRFRLGFDCSHAETSIPPFLQSSSGGESKFWQRTPAVCRSVKLVGPPNVGTNRTKSAAGRTTIRSSAANASPSTMATRIYKPAFFSRPSSWILCSKISRMYFIGSEPE